MLNNTPNQPSKFWIKNWVDINYDSCGTSLHDYSDVYIRIIIMYTYMYTYIHTITIPIKTTAVAATNSVNKNAIFKNCAPFTDCISEINNTKVDNVKDIVLVIIMYNVIKYSNNYSKTSESLWQYYRYEQALDNTGNIATGLEPTTT